MRLGGVTAPMVLDGPTNRAAFQAYVEQILITAFGRGNTVILEDLSAHKGSELRRSIEAAEATLRHLPPCSFGINPVENAFFKLKALLRTAAARSNDNPWNAIRDVLPRSTPQNSPAASPPQGTAPD